MQHDLPPGLARPAQRALQAAGYTTLEKLSTLPEAEVARLHGIGPNALVLLKQAMQAKGLTFAKAGNSKR
ncbi:helix-hairpin-helix domain-containing protein [Chitinophaga japonensis]|uniref:Helix-hairpin-helix protein n=1 Tax=Chitinophaga japonensis TaxID=104662 RepID=A0A562SS50_CHIJA|nr:DNA-binding protein [Chitinophaga japonensis]TWI84087.1 hypothetical protein LX66_4449 [Chitinophaga japonensis]